MVQNLDNYLIGNMMMVCRANMEQAQGHMTMELQKSLLEQMNNRLRETEEHIRQEIASRVSVRVSH